MSSSCLQILLSEKLNSDNYLGILYFEYVILYVLFKTFVQEMSVGTLNIGLARLVKLTHIMEWALKREVSSRNLLLLRLVQLLILLPLLLKPLLLQHLLVHLVHLLAGLLHALLLHLRKQVKKRNQGGKPTCVSDFGVLFFLVTGRESSL